MTHSAQQTDQPPKLRASETGEIDIGSVADILEWFLAFDERTSRMRHEQTNELFQWKQQDDKVNGIGIYPFENAEARFAIGCIQALSENNSEPLLKLWISDVLNALNESREAKTEIVQAYKLDDDMDASPIERAQKLTTTNEKRMYLTSCWLELLCTAEARVLGWIYQEMYGKPFAP